MNTPPISVGLESWIIQDGNYLDFEVGQRARFALEFHSRAFYRVTSREHFLNPVSGGVHRGRGTVLFMSDEAWVLDLGIVLAYQGTAAPEGVRMGDRIEAEFRIGVDPFFYFEGLYRMPGMPALTYEWRIEDILLETTPRRSDKIGRQTVLSRVPGTPTYRSVPRTDAWEDDGGHASYVMICSRLSAPSAPATNPRGR